MVAVAGRKTAVGLLKESSKNGELSSIDTQRLIASSRLSAAIAKVVRNEILMIAQGRTEYLKLISHGRNVIIKATDGTRIIADAERIFLGGVDDDFRTYAVSRGEVKRKTATEVYQLTKKGPLRNIFGSFGVNFNQLCFTQDQIIEFFESKPEWVCQENCWTYFMFKEGNEYFILCMCLCEDGTYVDLFRPSDIEGAELETDGSVRVVVPKL